MLTLGFYESIQNQDVTTSYLEKENQGEDSKVQ